MKEKMFFGNGNYKFEVTNLKTPIVSVAGERQGEDEMSFFISDGDKMLKANKQPISVNLSKDEAKKLAIQILKLVAKPVFQTGGISIDNYGECKFTLYHTQRENGELCNDPLLSIDGVQADEILEDGSISIPLTNKSAKELISGLAMIV